MLIKKRYILAFLFILLFFATVSVSFAENMYIGFSGTEMRSKPNAMDSKVVTKIDPYSPVTVFEKVSDYYNHERNGWEHRSLLSSTPEVVVTSDNSNLRREPGTNQPVVFQLSKGMTAKFLEK